MSQTPSYPWSRARPDHPPQASSSQHPKARKREPYPWAKHRTPTAPTAVFTVTPTEDTPRQEKRRQGPARGQKVDPGLDVANVTPSLVSFPAVAPPAPPMVEPSAEAVALAQRLQGAPRPAAMFNISPGEKVVDLDTFLTSTERLILTTSGRMLEAVTSRAQRYLQAVGG